jgi:hypothetical protein
MKKFQRARFLILICAGTLNAAEAVTPQAVLTPPVVIAATQTLSPTSATPVSAPAATLMPTTVFSTTPTIFSTTPTASVVSPVAASVTVTAVIAFVTTPQALTAPAAARSAWLDSQRQLDQISSREKKGSLTAPQAAELRVEVNSIRIRYGLRQAADEAQLNPEQKLALNLRLAAEAKKIRKTNPR